MMNITELRAMADAQANANKQLQKAKEEAEWARRFAKLEAMIEGNAANGLRCKSLGYHYGLDLHYNKCDWNWSVGPQDVQRYRDHFEPMGFTVEDHTNYGDAGIEIRW